MSYNVYFNRCKTSIQQKLPKDLEIQLERFKKKVKQLRRVHKFEDNLIINMDETPVYFDMPGSRTIERKGKKEVRVRSTGTEKRRFTAVLACKAAGVMLPPIIIFKGKRELKKLKIPRGVVVKVQSKGWNDATLTKVWLQNVVVQHTKKQQALLVWDTFKGHLTDELESMLRKSNIITAVIPGGCTSKIQPLDVCINKPYKNNFRASWMSYMQESVSHLENGERLQPPSKQQVVNWVVAANQHIGGNPVMIKKSFLVCGVSNALDGSQNHIIRCAKELPTLSVTYSSSTETSDRDPFESSDPEGGQNETSSSDEETKTDEEAETSSSNEEAETSSSDKEAEASSDDVSQSSDPEFESDSETSSNSSEYQL